MITLMDVIMKGIYAAFQAHSPATIRILKEYKAKSVGLWNQCFVLVDDLYGKRHIVNVETLKNPYFIQEINEKKCKIYG